MSLGFERAGIKTLWAIDNQPIVIKTHIANFPNARASVRDIKDITLADLSYANVWTCGIPCANYSTGGLKTYDDLVTWHIIRLLNETAGTEVAPDYLFFENVPQYMGKPPHQSLVQAIAVAGFKYKEAIFSHADYGAPSIRRRWHLIAYRDKLPWPKQTHMEGPNVLSLPLWVRFGEIRQKRVMKPRYMSARALKGIISRQRKKVQQGIERDCGVHACLYIAEDNDMMYTMMASAYKGLNRNQAIVVPHGHGFRDPTELEWRRVQGFPESYILKGTKRQRYEQLGRAVPPMVAEAFAKAIKEQEE